MILLFSRSFHFGRRSSGLATVFWPLLLPSKMNFIYTFFPCCLHVSSVLRSADVSGRLHMQIFGLPFNSDSPPKGAHPAWGKHLLGLVASSTGASHGRSCAVEGLPRRQWCWGFLTSAPECSLCKGCASGNPCGGTSCQMLHCSPAAQMCFGALKKGCTADLKKRCHFSNDSLWSFLIALYQAAIADKIAIVCSTYRTTTQCQNGGNYSLLKHLILCIYLLFCSFGPFFTHCEVQHFPSSMPSCRPQPSMLT